MWSTGTRCEHVFADTSHRFKTHVETKYGLHRDTDMETSAMLMTTSTCGVVNVFALVSMSISLHVPNLSIDAIWYMKVHRFQEAIFLHRRGYSLILPRNVAMPVSKLISGMPVIASINCGNHVIGPTSAFLFLA